VAPGPEEEADGPTLLTAADLLCALLAVACAAEAPDQVDLVLERAALGRSYKEIAAARGITAGAAKRRYQRTIIRMRRTMEEQALTLAPPLDASTHQRVLAIITAHPEHRDSAGSEA
jgi:DNA-directed RNA polymerase specialized sigma24 family protein